MKTAIIRLGNNYNSKIINNRRSNIDLSMKDLLDGYKIKQGQIISCQIIDQYLYVYYRNMESKNNA